MPYVLSKARRGPRAGVIQEAAVSNDFPRILLEAMRKGETIEGERGQIRLEGSRWLSELELDPDAQIRRMSGEQSNTCMVMGRQVMMKIYRHLRSGIQPELEMSRYLSDADFPNAPALLGCMQHVDEDGTETALAAAFANIHNQGDGWTVIVDSLDRELEEATFAGENRPDETGGVPYSLALIETIGRRTAELHRTLAANAEDPAFAPEPVTDEDLAKWVDTIHARANHVFELLSRVEGSLEEHSREAVDRLIAMREEFMQKLQRFMPRGSSSQKIRLHGDYHLGQVLVAQDDIFIVDFEGEPAKSLDERRAKAPPARDIASMLRSFDYAANMAIDRQWQTGVAQLSEIESRAHDWRDAATRTFLEAYTSVLVEAGDTVMDNSAQELLTFFLADKLLYEITYEALNRPAWLWVPAKAALELIETDGAPPPKEEMD
jgi:maltose alpha-D-glucosyltransferase/alpha-amylase